MNDIFITSFIAEQTPPPGCWNYESLDESDRNYRIRTANFDDAKYYDNNKLPAPDIRKPHIFSPSTFEKSPQYDGENNWYRFEGAAGTRMATRTEVTSGFQCSTLASGYLDLDSHPQLMDGVVQEGVKACFYAEPGPYYSKAKCWLTTNVTVQKCEGGYYVYKLPPVPGLGRYCSAT